MRRQFMIALLVMIGACGSDKAKVEPKEEKEPVKEEAEPTQEAQPEDEFAGIETKEVSYSAGDTKLQGFLAWDGTKSEKRPGVIVVHEWWGHNDYVRMRAKELAKLGYVAFAIDMYGEGKKAEHPKDAMKFMNETLADLDGAIARFEAGKKVLAEHEKTEEGKLAAIGYCFGGGVVLHAARAGQDLDGVVSFHGSLAPKEPAEKGKVKAKVLVLGGAEDPFVPEKDKDAFKAEMEAANVDFQFIEYEGAKHAFTVKEATEKGKKFDLPLAYNAEADKKSWAKMREFLQSIFEE